MRTRRLSFRAIRVFLAFTLVAGTGSAGAQGATRVIVRTPSCINCTIVPERVVSLGGAADSVLLTPNSLVIRDARGRYYVKGYEAHNFVVFDSTGKYLRAVGRRGNGPEEFTSITAIALGRADSIMVFQNTRVTVLTPTFAFARSFQLPVQYYGVTQLNNGNLLVANREGRVTTPLIVITPTGSAVRDFGGASAQSQCSECGRRAVAVSNSPDRVWLGIPNQYSLQLWDIAGALVETLTQSVDWFTPWTTQVGELMMQPRLMRMNEDSEGRLWTQVVAPDPNYSPSRASRSAVPIPTGTSPGATQAAFASQARQAAAASTITRVEIVDTRSARLVVSADVPDGFSLMPKGLASSWREDGDGVIHFDIWRLVVKQK